MSGPPVAPMPRCCDSHADWKQLHEHLVVAFPCLDPADVLNEVQSARGAVEHFGLAPDERLQTAELMARHQLMVMSGEMTAAARLDPETHQRRRLVDSA